MSQPLGLYYRLQAELRRKIASDSASSRLPPRRTKPATDATMFIRLIAVTAGLLIAVSLIMQSAQ